MSDAIDPYAELLPWSNGRIAVVSRAGLITLKLTAGRPQDLVDVERLQALEEPGPASAKPGSS